MNALTRNANTPSWRVITVKSRIPESLKKLDVTVRTRSNCSTV